jgi:hypothetical protein
MAQIIIDIPDNVVVDVRDTLAPFWGYKETVPDPASTPEAPLPDITNPQSKTAFLKAYLANWIKQDYVGAKAQQASITAEVTAKQSASSVAIS